MTRVRVARLVLLLVHFILQLLMVARFNRRLRLLLLLLLLLPMLLLLLLLLRSMGEGRAREGRACRSPCRARRAAIVLGATRPWSGRRGIVQSHCARQQRRGITHMRRRVLLMLTLMRILVQMLMLVLVLVLMRVLMLVLVLVRVRVLMLVLVRVLVFVRVLMRVVVRGWVLRWRWELLRVWVLVLERG